MTQIPFYPKIFKLETQGDSKLRVLQGFFLKWWKSKNPTKIVYLHSQKKKQKESDVKSWNSFKPSIKKKKRKIKTELYSRRNVEKSEAHRLTDTEGQQPCSSWIMPQQPKRNKTLDLKWNLGFWQENAEGGKRKREKDKKGGVGGRKRKWIEKYELLN